MASSTISCFLFFEQHLRLFDAVHRLKNMTNILLCAKKFVFLDLKF